MAIRRSVGVVLLLLAVVHATSSQHLISDSARDAGKSSDKVPKSINHESKHVQNRIEQKVNSIEYKIEDMQTRRDSFDDNLDNNETEFHSLPGKPSKFDRDISELIHTDLKSMHESEAERLKANSEMEGTFAKDTSNGRWNDTRRIDNPLEDEAIASSEMNIESQRCNRTIQLSCLEQELGRLIEKMSTIEVYNITNFAQIVRTPSLPESGVSARDNSVIDKVTRYAKEHILRIRMPSDFSLARGSRTFFGAIFQENRPFLTGFGLGFLAFGFKHLMMPLIIGMQFVKFALFALFLPSILGGIGKIVGKGVSSFSQISQSATAQPEENFDFKDNAGIYSDDYMHNQPIGTLPASAMYGDQGALNTGNQYVATPGANQRISYVNTLSDNYYSRNSMQGTTKRQDYKVFHDIPTSSLLLTNYDPFYSPLLSRLDAVFSRLGYSTEGCREYAICAMYRSPARYAPYSNLVSAQLSRELNELRKPSSDNPDVLRFFKYMKAAKDGQDGVQCEDIYVECASRGSSSGQNQAMLATYQDINKLVQARKI